MAAYESQQDLHPYGHAQHSYPPGTSTPYSDEFTPPQRGYGSTADLSNYSRPSFQEERGLIPGAAAFGTAHGNPSQQRLNTYKDEIDGGYGGGGVVPPAVGVYHPPAKRRRWLVWGLILLVLVAIALGVGLYYGGVFGGKDDDKQPAASSNSSANSTSVDDDTNANAPTNNSTATPVVLLAGGHGSQVTADDGTNFVYNNTLHGTWAYDSANPWSGPVGQANAWTTPVNESWKWGVDKQYGVNIGGWLVLEPFISPAIFQQYFPRAVDEWTLSELLRADTSANGGIQKIEDHYKTFITERDFANIAAAGLNWIRLQVPFWAVAKLPDEPYLELVAWDYFIKALGWARKYGLRVNLDLHTCPGSQNGWNHSGRVGMPFKWLMTSMGVANAQRTLDVLRVFGEFVTRPEIAPIVPMFGIVNEPQGNTIGVPILKNFYFHAYQMLRGLTGVGAGPAISLHTGFADTEFDGWLPRHDRLMLDKHPYLIFGSRQSDDPVLNFTRTPCTEWVRFHYGTRNTFGLNSAGEWSAAINDCGLYLNEVGVPADYDLQFGDGACDTWNNWETWDAQRKTDMMSFARASMDAFREDSFFWTWRIGPSTLDGGKIVTPQWSYELGWANGWLPPDPRASIGECERLGYTDPNALFDGVYEPWMISGQGATLAPTTTEAYVWPPPTLTDVADADAIAHYTPTGPLPTLPVPTALVPGGAFTPAMGGAGWHVAIAGCAYPDPTAAPAPLPATCRMAA